MTTVGGWFVAAATVVAVLTSGPKARADAKRECVAAYEETQALRDGGKLVEARERALACSARQCSRYIVKECTQWLGELDANTPTVVFAAQDTAGAETLDVRVAVDGRVLGEKLDVKAVPLDPGEHVVRFVLAGAAPIEQRILLRQGEKNRKVVASFRVGPTVPPRTPDEAPRTSGVRTAGFVISAVGVVGLGFGIAAGVVAISDKNDAQCNAAGVCAPGASGLLASLRTAAHVSTAGFVSGGILLAAGVTMITIGSVKITPAVGSAGTGLTAAGTFQ